jgi:hypothetical protein
MQIYNILTYAVKDFFGMRELQRLAEQVIRNLKLTSVDLDRPISDLLAEASSDLVRKHGRTEVVCSTVATLLPHAITGGRGSMLLEGEPGRQLKDLLKDSRFALPG